MARIALAVGVAALGAALSVMTGFGGIFAVGAWGQDIFAGASLGFSAGDARGGLFFKEREEDEIEHSRD